VSNNILAKRGDTVRTYTDRIRSARRGVVVSDVYQDIRRKRQVIDVRWESGAVSTESLNAVEVL
jgi:hypothetical protein